MRAGRINCCKMASRSLAEGDTPDEILLTLIDCDWLWKSADTSRHRLPNNLSILMALCGFLIAIFIDGG